MTNWRFWWKLLRSNFHNQENNSINFKKVLCGKVNKFDEIQTLCCFPFIEQTY